MSRKGQSSGAAQNAQNAPAEEAPPKPELKPSQMSPEQYLDKFSVTAYFKDVITLLLENRPENPLEFIADYFKNVIQGTSPLVRSYRYIRLTKTNREAFWDNVTAAYYTLEMKSTNGLTATDFHKLLQMICSDFPVEVTNAVLTLLTKRESERVGFEDFAAGVNACLLYEEFFDQAEVLFASLDKEGTNCIGKKTFFDALASLVADHEKSKAMDGMPTSAELQQWTKEWDAHEAESVSFADFIKIVFRFTSPSRGP